MTNKTNGRNAAASRPARRKNPGPLSNFELQIHPVGRDDKILAQLLRSEGKLSHSLATPLRSFALLAGEGTRPREPSLNSREHLGAGRVQSAFRESRNEFGLQLQRRGESVFRIARQTLSQSRLEGRRGSQRSLQRLRILQH